MDSGRLVIALAIIMALVMTIRSDIGITPHQKEVHRYEIPKANLEDNSRFPRRTPGGIPPGDDKSLEGQ